MARVIVACARTTQPNPHSAARGDQGPFATSEAAAADLERYVGQKASFVAIPYEASSKTKSHPDVDAGGLTLLD